MPGVARFWGKGHVRVAGFLYDKDGRLVGSDQVLATGPDDIPWGFSAVVELFGNDR